MKEEKVVCLSHTLKYQSLAYRAVRLRGENVLRAAVVQIFSSSVAAHLH